MTLIDTGATDIRRVFSSEQIPGLLRAYVAGVKVTMAIAIVASGLSLIVCLFSRWKRLPTGKDTVSKE